MWVGAGGCICVWLHVRVCPQWRLSVLVRCVPCRDVRFSSFMSEFKGGKERALELLSRLPHCIPHRQVGTLLMHALPLDAEESAKHVVVW